MRRHVLFAAAIAAITPFVAHAAPPHPVIGVNVGSSGSVQRCNASPASGVPVVVCGTCTYHALLTPSNTLVVNFAGAATALSKDAGTVVVATEVYCSVSNAGHFEDAWGSATGPAAAVAHSTLFSTGPKEWAVQPITICVDALATTRSDGSVASVPLGLSCATPE